MSNKQTTLTLNGKRYNALTGQLTDGGQFMDVVTTPVSQSMQVAVPTPPPASIPQPLSKPTAGPKVMDVSRSTTSHLKPRQPQRAQTLVRSAVSKPQPSLKSQTKVTAPTKVLALTNTSIIPKLSVAQVNTNRQTRATQTTKSPAISKFSAGTAVQSPVLSPQASAAVKVERPAEPVAASAQPASASQSLFERAIAAAEAPTAATFDPKQLAKQARRQAKQAAKASRPVRHHLASVVAASVAVLAIGGFIGLQHKTDLTLRFANAQAGFNASLPTYQPSGYGVGDFTYSVGNVGTTFQDGANGRSYSLNQQTTKWDSQALLDNFVAVNYPSYQALQSGDQVIYVYGKNDASWIKNGIWYQLKSNGNLSTSQVLNIAASV